MKKFENIKYKIIIPFMFIVSFVGCKRPNPMGKDVYAIVKDKIDQTYYLDLEKQEILILRIQSKNYNIGDTVWFSYDKYTKEWRRIPTYNVIKDPKPDYKNHVIKQQQELYHKKR
ncbi:MAG: hypothetical protein J6W08_00190 [Alphaproteobacteria bacterium]|nr:hypothetical protein [Alphaproteobacteria bacterium]